MEGGLALAQRGEGGGVRREYDRKSGFRGRLGVILRTSPGSGVCLRTVGENVPRRRAAGGKKWGRRGRGRALPGALYLPRRCVTGSAPPQVRGEGVTMSTRAMGRSAPDRAGLA